MSPSAESLKEIARRKNFGNAVACASASALAQISANADVRPHLTERASKCADLLSAIPISHSRSPGFFTPTEARSVIDYAGERSDVVQPAMDVLTKRSAALSSIKASPFRTGGRVEIEYKVASGDRPLTDHARSRMEKSVDFLRRSQTTFRERRSEADEAMAFSSKPNLQLLHAFERVITDSASYLNSRNQLAQDGFDVREFDKLADENNLLLLAAWRHELDPVRDHVYRTLYRKKAAPSSPSMN